MYDIATKAVNRLSGELSTAFVNVAEENATAQDLDGAAIYDSGIVEQVNAGSNEEQGIEETAETTTAVSNDSAEYDTNYDMDMGVGDSSAEGSENIETVVKFETPKEIVKEEEKKAENQVQINSGYSVIKS